MSVSEDKMKNIIPLLEKNKTWAERVLKSDPDFFNRLSTQQSPKILWIGCSDSRVPATQICDLDPGEMFVHRNVANLVIHTDFSCLSVVQYAVEVLKVTDIIICGHYSCGGVKAALENTSLGLIDNWLRNIKDVYQKHIKEMDKLKDNPQAQFDRLCELNVEEQVANLCHTTLVQDAWNRGQQLSVHGLIYGLKDGIITDLGLHFNSKSQVTEVFRID